MKFYTGQKSEKKENNLKQFKKVTNFTRDSFNTLISMTVPFTKKMQIKKKIKKFYNKYKDNK